MNSNFNKFKENRFRMGEEKKTYEHYEADKDSPFHKQNRSYMRQRAS